MAQRLAVAGRRRAVRRRPVCITPTTAVGRRDYPRRRPVGELLDRFEQASIDEVLARVPKPVAAVPAASRRHVTGALAVVLDSPDVSWAGRTAIYPCTASVARRVAGQPKTVRRHTPVHGCSPGANADGVVTLSVPLSDIWITSGSPAVLHRRRRHAGGDR